MDLNDKTIDVNVRHSELVRNLAKPGIDILKTLSVNDVMVMNALFTIQSQICESAMDELEHGHYDGEKCHLLHMLLGASGEQGELLDAIKKSIIYQKPLDRENAIEEIGDFLFYVRGFEHTSVESFRNSVINMTESPEFVTIFEYCNVTVEECLEVNIKKLQERYSSGKYSDQQAQDRADKS